MWFLFFLSFVTSQWASSNYPNPRKSGYKDCKMRSVSNVCDPDEVLTEGERYRLNSELTRLTGRTEENGNTFCARKGIDPVLVIMQEQGNQEFADELRTQWNIDGQCHRAAIFLLCAGDRKIYYSGDTNAGIEQTDFQAIASAQEIPLRSGQYTAATANIFKELGKKTNPLSLTTLPPSQSSFSLSTLVAFIISLFLL